MNIHPTAIVETGAQIHESAVVGPFSIIESGAVIGEGCVIESCVKIFGKTRMGDHNKVCHGATIGSHPQDLSFVIEKAKPLTIGSHNHFKENVNISCGVKTPEGTRIGNHNYFMASTHVGHDCIIGNHNIFANYAGLAGHVELGHHCFISGLVGIHQFVRIGDFVMAAGCSKIVKDVPPFTLVDGNPARLVGLNSVGLKRNGFPSAARAAIKRAYHQLFHAGLNTTQALALLTSQDPTTETLQITRFFTESQRGVTDHR